MIDRRPGRERSRARASCAYIGAAMLAGLTMPVHAQQQTDVPTLSNVVVTASGFEQMIADAPATITVIPREELEGKAYRNITDALQDIPGVSVEGGAGGKLESTQITIRGMGEQYVLFLVDGKPLGASSEAYYNGFGGGAQVNWLPPLSAIERIEVIRGPMSSLYGSSALGGVINVITKKVTDEWIGNVTLDATLQQHSESGNAYQGRYYLSGPLVQDRLGLTLYGSRYQRREDEFEAGYPQQRIVNNNARLDWVLNESHSLQLEAGLTTTDNQRTEKTGGPSDMDNERTVYGLTHDWKWGRNINTKTYVLTEDVKIENGSYDSTYKSTVLNTKTLIPLDAHMISVGAEYKTEETDHDESRFPGSKSLNLTRWQTALFIEDEYNLTDDFALTAGLRFDKNEHYGTHLTPRLYGVYHWDDNLVLKGGVSGGYKTPTLKQADDNIVEQAGRGRSWDMGNPDLEPESSTNYELGFAWSSPQDVNFGIMAYHTRFKDKIGKQYLCSTPAGAPPSCTYNSETRYSIQQYTNLDSAILQGVEASFSMPLGAVRLITNYTYSDSEITSGQDEGKPLNNTPRHMFNLGLDWQAGGRQNVWGKMKYKSDTIDGGEDRIPSYTLVDVGTTYKFSKHITGFLAVYNVFDKQVDSELFGKTLDGRRYYAGLSLDF
ncbi:TonB-dependent receptor [Allopusillimonas soli]|uniref:TonB-dependent receptor n=1 Tax=Allopusillimonas soli TaxID=659016 RepID=A0A853FDB9_9BURK|nr:TonB-dependent receptor [Allopusillimonas soli]NYT36066.1 TonB-dependent receptor [Allopusillimonas soli]TEA76405.1 TonB-dependent receptor [Allopusillimonas soli]